MEIKKLSETLSVGPQLPLSEVGAIAEAGFKSIMVNRPDGEGDDQPAFADMAEAANQHGLKAIHVPVAPGKIGDADVEAFARAMEDLPKPVFGFCRTGTRTTTLWALSQAGSSDVPSILGAAKSAGYDLTAVATRIANGGKVPTDVPTEKHQIVVVGGGAAGIAVAASMLARSGDLDIAIIDPAEFHYYQPGWTLVGAGIFTPEQTRKPLADLIPDKARHITSAAVAFDPENNAVILEGGRVVHYDRLVVAPGLKLDWAGVEGLPETLGKNGVTSNYRYDLAPYTARLVKEFAGGTALFTQPPMPIKCAGAPQKAMYLSCDAWRDKGVLANSKVEFLNAGPGLFGVADYVPPLMEYVKAYGIELSFGHNLFKIDGPARTAWFKKTDKDGNVEVIERKFDMIHVVPPQRAPDFIAASPLAAETGWVSVDQSTLKHTKYENVYSLGDVMSAPNAKTAAAARKQAPVVAENLLADIGKHDGSERAIYDGYGSCPLTVEKGKIVLAEFGYGGKRMPSFPKWLIDDLKPSRLAWFLKEKLLPPIYWNAMLKGREPLAKPKHEKR
ncbi:bifunctional protein tyrosine phosphatase family protein/NAD(P)/FAD-dependent oxidoreductase [Pelagibacterium montanilacus]|uniref:bifunctional protein tyrosine phosphatase family protein/NAD(P)/FAD-dependent oxidoreductase n=1 Tax=Pelagibacterium montanilacus TaxID=2185280 RepID=UPI000F8E4411|nr:bifunctional protein tyrosine phosphatase family protein/NAD(P)/FAD-dependent oxidoreductase [Pelagibacterium montanilacus]